MERRKLELSLLMDRLETTIAIQKWLLNFRELSISEEFRKRKLSPEKSSTKRT
jgi:hypothetical protein